MYISMSCWSLFTILKFFQKFVMHNGFLLLEDLGRNVELGGYPENGKKLSGLKNAEEARSLGTR